MSWNYNPMAASWLATHLWDYYDYTRDEKFLRETAYPLIKGCAEFSQDFLWKRADGTLTAAPSTSPEHEPIDEGTTFTHAVIRDILTDAIRAAKVLGVDGKEVGEWQEVLKRLAPYQIGRYGQLMEWSRDIDPPPCQPPLWFASGRFHLACHDTGTGKGRLRRTGTSWRRCNGMEHGMETQSVGTPARR